MTTEQQIASEIIERDEYYLHDYKINQILNWHEDSVEMMVYFDRLINLNRIVINPQEMKCEKEFMKKEADKIFANEDGRSAEEVKQKLKVAIFRYYLANSMLQAYCRDLWDGGDILY